MGRIGTFVWAVAGIFLAAGLTFGSLRIAGSELSAPAAPIPALREVSLVASPHADHATPSPSPSPTPAGKKGRSHAVAPASTTPPTLSGGGPHDDGTVGGDPGDGGGPDD